MDHISNVAPRIHRVLLSHQRRKRRPGPPPPRARVRDAREPSSETATTGPRATTVMGAQSRTGKARAKRDGVPLDAKDRKVGRRRMAKRPGIAYAQKRKAERAARDEKKRSGDRGERRTTVRCDERRRSTDIWSVRYRGRGEKVETTRGVEAREREGEG